MTSIWSHHHHRGQRGVGSMASLFPQGGFLEYLSFSIILFPFLQRTFPRVVQQRLWASVCSRSCQDQKLISASDCRGTRNKNLRKVFLGASEHKSGSGREQEYWKQRSYLSCKSDQTGSVQSWNRNFIGKLFYSGDFTSPHHIPSLLISIIEVNISWESFYHYYFKIRLLPLLVCYITLVFKGF